MSDNEIISFEDAKKQLDNIMSSSNKFAREQLISYAVTQWMSMKLGGDGSDDEVYCDENSETMDDPVAKLNSIVKEIKEKVPFNAILPSEITRVPEKGDNSNCNPEITTHVDAFLYDDDELEDLEKEGKIKKSYCLDCGSKNISPLILISHSLSRDELYHVFNNLLPTLNGKTVLDVGSRLGAVLYGAYVYTDASKIIGVEMNKDFCDLQNEIIKKFKMEKRIEVLHKRIEDVADVVKTADVVILNNVFEFYLTENEQCKVWEFLKNHIKKHAYIISRPKITTALANLQTNINIDEWVKDAEPNIPDKSKNLFDLEPHNQDDRYSEIACYQVL